MLTEAARRYEIDLDASIVIGDKLADMAAGQAAGCSTILVRTGYGADEEGRVSSASAVYDNLLAAVKGLTCPLNPV